MIYRYEVGYYPDAQNFKIDVYSDVAKAANAILNSIKETKNKYFYMRFSMKIKNI